MTDGFNKVSVPDAPFRLVRAAEEGDLATLKTLLAAGVSPDSRARDGSTALMLAAQKKGNAAVVQALVAAGASLELAGSGRETALMQALCVPDNTGVLQCLLDAGADIETRNGNGSSPLMRAAVAGDAGAVRLLLQRGANPAAVDNQGFTALQSLAFFLTPENEMRVANEAALVEVEKLLLQSGEIRAGYIKDSETARRAERFARLRNRAPGLKPRAGK